MRQTTWDRLILLLAKEVAPAAVANAIQHCTISSILIFLHSIYSHVYTIQGSMDAVCLDSASVNQNENL